MHLNDPALEVYHSLNENRLYHYYEPKPGLFIAESPLVIERAIAAGFRPESFLVEEEQMEVAKPLISGHDVPVYTCPHDELKALVGYPMTRGLLCAMRRKPDMGAEEALKDKYRIVILENVMNPTNVGAIFRSAAALGMEGVILTKGCADPLQRRSTRVSMGTVFSIPWAYMDSVTVDISLLRNRGFKTLAMALNEDSESLDSVSISSEERCAIIMGTEGDGLCQETIHNSDFRVMIPMSRGVDSLNVAAASAVAFWALRREQDTP